jgi:hypothetical protein
VTKFTASNLTKNLFLDVLLREWRISASDMTGASDLTLAWEAQAALQETYDRETRAGAAPRTATLADVSEEFRGMDDPEPTDEEKARDASTRARLLFACNVYSPGGTDRIPDEPEDIGLYPAGPEYKPVSRGDMIEKLEAHSLALILHDYTGVATTHSELGVFSDSDIRKTFIIHDLTPFLGDGSYDKSKETRRWYGYRQHARVVRNRVCNLLTAQDNTAILIDYLANPSLCTPIELAARRKARYFALHPLFIRLSQDKKTSRMLRIDAPNPQCATCKDVDPRHELYCDDCYKILRIYL